MIGNERAVFYRTFGLSLVTKVDQIVLIFSRIRIGVPLIFHSRHNRRENHFSFGLAPKLGHEWIWLSPF